MRMVAEFQSFIRDLYDLAVEHLVTVAAPPPGLVALLTTAMTRGRAIDSGNPTQRALRTDFGRIGIRNPGARLARQYPQWDRSAGGQDPSNYRALLEVRNAIAHGNRVQLEEHRRQRHPDTMTWGRSQLPMLNRAARGFDRIVWEHLSATTGTRPW